MVKVNKEDQERFLELVKKSFDRGCSIGEIREAVMNDFDIVYSKRSICYWIDVVTREERIEMYKRQNKIIEEWNRSDPPRVAEEILLAEVIYSAVALHDKVQNEVLMNHV
jgi:hypothetical protein